MQKVYPADYITRHEQAQIDAGYIKGAKEYWPPEQFLARVEAGLEKPLHALTTYRTITSQLCEYVCRFWNSTLYTPVQAWNEVNLDPTDEQLDAMLEKQVYQQSLD